MSVAKKTGEVAVYDKHPHNAKSPAPKGAGVELPSPAGKVSTEWLTDEEAEL